MEIWRNIKGYENLYQVSNLGNVRRLESIVIYSNGNIVKHKCKILKQEKNKGNKKGYYKRVSLCKDNKVKRFQVHRLVALAFIHNPLNKECVNHIDGNPANNNLLNLEWVTYSENEIHSYKVLNKKNGNRKLTSEDVSFIRNNIFYKAQELADMYKVSVRTIYNVKKVKYYV